MSMKTNQTENITQIILHAVLEVQLGKHKLACFLKGSKAKEMTTVSQKNVYGGLFWHNLEIIEGFIEQIETMGLIERKVVATFPREITVYVLTETGKKAKDAKIEIPLQELKKPIILGESEMQTWNLYQQGKKLSEIAKERNLTESTIYLHFYRLIVHEKLKSSEIIPKEVYDKIERECKKFKKQPPLKEIKEKLPAEISYEQIRCVAAEFFKEK